MTGISKARAAALERLARPVHEQLEILFEKPKNWVRDTPGTDTDIVIVGAGQTGLAAACCSGERNRL